MWERKNFKPMTTNQSESINHVLKNYMSWEKTNLPEMINNVKSVVKFQYDNLEFSMYNEGDYVFYNMFSYHQYQAFKVSVKKQTLPNKKIF